MAVPASRAAAGVLRDYQAAIQDSDRAIRAAGDPDARFAVPVDGNRHTLRWVIAHMTSETARHAVAPFRCRRDLQGLEDTADGGCADPVAELEQLALDPLVRPRGVPVASRSISAAISALTGGRPIRFG